MNISSSFPSSSDSRTLDKAPTDIEIKSIRYINLDKNWHRRLMISYILKGLPYKIIRSKGIAFSADNPEFEKYLMHGVEEFVRTTNRVNGVTGCWIAHSKVLEDVSDRDGITVVLEDDFICKRNFFEEALNMIKRFNRNFDVIIFDPWGDGPLSEHKISDNIYQPRTVSYPYYGGTHCLFINNRQIPKILELKLNSRIKDYDGLLIGHYNIDTFIFYTDLCETRAMGSDIHTSKNNSVQRELWSWTTKRFLDCLENIKMSLSRIVRQVQKLV